LLRPVLKGCASFSLVSSVHTQIGKRVLYGGATKLCMPEKPGFMGAVWHSVPFIFMAEFPAVHLQFM
jgi:hypothetical protein